MQINKCIYLLISMGFMLIFTSFKFYSENISSDKSRYGLECPTVREAFGGSIEPEQHSGPCFSTGGKMNAALKLVDQPKKDYINRYLSSQPKEGVLFSDFIRTTATRKAKRMSATYLNTYTTLISHLEKFSKQNDVSLYTNSINEEFLEDFITYLNDLDLKQSYVKSVVEHTKAMVRKAGTYGYAVDPSYDDVVIEEDDPFAIYLSMNDISRIYFYDDLSKIQKQQKDLFVVGCLTALRYSDYSTLSPRDFQGNFIIKTTKKTGKRVVIPVHDFIKQIYDRYNGEISRGTTVQQFDRILKVIMQKIGFNDQVTYTYTRGGKLITETKQKWELISSHTARRSAATNMYLTGRMKTFEIMAITGHTTEKSFFRYIRITNDDISKQLAGDIYFKA